MTQRSTPSHVNSLTQVVIAAGGKGTRLVKSGYLQPKCLIELNGQTVLSRIMTLAAQQNIRKILILTGYGADQIKQYCSNSKFKDLKIEFSDEEKPLGNGGALVNALPQLDETFLFLYGDLVLDINFIRMHKFHKENDADITIFAHPGDHPLDADIITVDKQNRLKKILKYPHEFRPIPNLINSAIYMINRDSLKSLPHSKIDFAQHALPILLMNRKDIFVYRSREYVRDMGTPERIKIIRSHLSKGLPETLKMENPIPLIMLNGDLLLKYLLPLHSNSGGKFKFNFIELVSFLNQAGILLTYFKPKSEDASKRYHDGEKFSQIEDFLGENSCYFDDSIDLNLVNFDCGFKNIQNRYNVNAENCWLIGDESLYTRSITHASFFYQLSVHKINYFQTTEPDFLASRKKFLTILKDSLNK